MKLLVNALGAWVAVRAAEGHYPRPVAIGLTMLVSRLGAPAAALAIAGYALKRLDEAGAFDDFKQARRSSNAPSRLNDRRSEASDESNPDRPQKERDRPAEA